MGETETKRETPQELRERLIKEQIVMQEKFPHELIYPAGTKVEIQIEQTYQLARIAEGLEELKLARLLLGKLCDILGDQVNVSVSELQHGGKR